MLKQVLSRLWRASPKLLRRTIVKVIEPHFTVATAAVIVDDDGRVLLLEHVFRVGPAWGIPGGFLARREQPDDAIRRELREEIDLEVTDLEIAFVRAVPRTNQVEIIYRARAVGDPQPRGMEINAFGWFEETELEARLSITQRGIVERALRGRTRVR